MRFVLSIDDWVISSCTAKALLTQTATCALTAGDIFVLIAGPSQVKGSVEFETLTDYGGFVHVDEWRTYTDIGLGVGAEGGHLLVSAEELAATVRLLPSHGIGNEDAVRGPWR